MLRVSALGAGCSFTITYGVLVSGSDIHVTATAHGNDWACPELDGTGAGYTTLLTLPALAAGPAGLPTVFHIWATISETGYSPGSNAYERMIGQFTLQFSAPDTTTRFGGNVTLFVDSLGCWRARPWSQAPQPLWVFATPLALAPGQGSWQAFLSGRLVPVSPPVCGNPVAIDPSALEVTLTANPYPAPKPATDVTSR